MNSLEQFDTTSKTWQEQVNDWRALPRLLVSRQWRWWTLGALGLASLFIWLGFWQLDRLQQRRSLNALVERRFTAPLIALTGQPLDINQYEYQRVTVRGTYDPSQTILLRNRTFEGRAGADVLTPLRIAGSNQSVLVDRGWVPQILPNVAALQQYATTEPVEITGVLRRPRTPTSSIGPQDNVPASGRLDAWFFPDIQRISRQVPYPLLPFYVEQLPQGNQTEPPIAQATVDYQNEGSHLSYAIQWFAFTIIGVVGYAGLVVQQSQLAHARRRNPSS